MTRNMRLWCLLALVACADEPRQLPVTAAAMQRPSMARQRIAAADELTRQYADSRLAKWNIRAHAAGPQCSALVVEIDLIMEDTLIESLHYGVGAYDMIEGGVQRFYRERAFRGVAYRDATANVWTYGILSPPEVKTLEPCG